MTDKSFYSEINDDNKKKYQRYFGEMLNVANVENLTKRSQGLEYDRAEYGKSYEGLETIWDRAEQDGLIPFNLQIMFEQYIFSDVWQRERYKNHWVEKVLNRKDVDFFPDPIAIWKTLEK